MAKDLLDINYIKLSAWMVTKLKLKSNDLLVFGLIFGFTQDGESEFRGSIDYICKWINSSRPTVSKSLQYLCEKQYLTKRVEIVNNVTFNRYKTNLPVVLNLLEGSKETLHGGSKETLPGGSKETLHNNTTINNTNIDINNNNNIVPFATVSEKKEKTNLQKVNDLYYEMHRQVVGNDPNFTSVDAKNLRDLYKYFLKINGNDENNALDSIRYIFVKFDTLTPFLRNVKPQAILSNISAIIMHFKEKNKKSEFIDFSQQAENYQKNKM